MQCDRDGVGVAILTRGTGNRTAVGLEDLRRPLGTHEAEDSEATGRAKRHDVFIERPDSIGALAHLSVLLEDRSVT